MDAEIMLYIEIKEAQFKLYFEKEAQFIDKALYSFSNIYLLKAYFKLKRKNRIKSD